MRIWSQFWEGMDCTFTYNKWIWKCSRLYEQFFFDRIQCIFDLTWQVIWYNFMNQSGLRSQEVLNCHQVVFIAELYQYWFHWSHICCTKSVSTIAKPRQKNTPHKTPMLTTLRKFTPHKTPMLTTLRYKCPNYNNCV